VPPRIALFLVLASAFAMPDRALAQGQGRTAPVPPGAVTCLVIPVSGMTCALCTRGVETSIEGLDVVRGASADLASGLVRVEASAGKSLNIKDVKDRIQKAGFRVGGELEAEAVGRFGFGPDGRITFRVPGTPYAFQVLEGSELKRLFKEEPGLKGEFDLTFRLHEHPLWKPGAISIVRGEPHAPAGAPAVLR